MPRGELGRRKFDDARTDAAERLLGRDGAAFSMRDLASEAGLSFATPFNQFGSKAGIMRALSARRIARMRERLRASSLSRDAVSGVLAAVKIAAAVMLETPSVNRAIMAGIGGPADDAGNVMNDSISLWKEALGEGLGLEPSVRSAALGMLPKHLALSFRGALSFWSAGEVSDLALTSNAEKAAATALLGFASAKQRRTLLSICFAEREN